LRDRAATLRRGACDRTLATGSRYGPPRAAPPARSPPAEHRRLPAARLRVRMPLRPPYLRTYTRKRV